MMSADIRSQLKPHPQRRGPRVQPTTHPRWRGRIRRLHGWGRGPDYVCI